MLLGRTAFMFGWKMTESTTSRGQLIRLLSLEFSRLRKKNPRFSLRSLARRLGVSPALLSGIMSGKLNVTKKAGAQILRELRADPHVSRELLRGLSNRQASRAPRATSDSSYAIVDMDQYEMIEDWYYFAILSLTETRNFRGESAWVARRLGIPLRQAGVALARLEKMGLLESDEHGRLRGTGKPFRTTSEIPSASLRNSHYQNLELARRSLDKDEVVNRDFSAMTVAIHPRHMAEAKRLLKEFRRKFADRLERGERTEVYRLCLQFFPLTKAEALSERN